MNLSKLDVVVFSNFFMNAKIEAIQFINLKFKKLFNFYTNYTNWTYSLVFYSNYVQWIGRLFDYCWIWNPNWSLSKYM